MPSAKAGTGRKPLKPASAPTGEGSDELSEAGQVLLGTLEQFLRDDGWPLAEEDAGDRALAMAVEGNNGRWLCVAQVPPDRDLVLFTSVIPAFVPPERRPRMAEFVARANFGMLLGAFELELDDGEVRFCTSVDFTGVDPAPLAASGVLAGMIRQVVYVNVANVDRYLPALMTVLYGDADPAEAVARAEAD